MRHGSNLDPPNRFESTHFESDHADEDLRRKIEYLPDASVRIVAENDSPDIPFRYSLNPYRGCVHGCAYCYARPTHEYLGMDAGLDFETRIVVKHDAARLFRHFLAQDRWDAEPIAFSGVTDCYQPAEQKFELTRQCLQVAQSCGQPLSIITKNALVLRDLSILREMAAANLVHVYLSITTLDASLARDMEPRTSIPDARLRAVETLAEAGIPVGVMVAPVIPGLNDTEIPNILEAASEAGAQTAGYVLLRLPLTVKPVFLEWLQRTQPLKAERVMQRVRATRDGKWNDSQWKRRATGQGEIAKQIGNLFQLFKRQHQLDQPLPPHNRESFHPPANASGQQFLF